MRTPYWTKKGHLGMTRQQLLEKLNTAAPAGYDAETIPSLDEQTVTWESLVPDAKAGAGSFFQASISEDLATWLSGQITADAQITRYVIVSFKIGTTENNNIKGTVTSNKIRWTGKVNSTTVTVDFIKDTTQVTVSASSTLSGSTTFTMSGLNLNLTDDFILAVKAAAK